MLVIRRSFLKSLVLMAAVVLLHAPSAHPMQLIPYTPPEPQPSIFSRILNVVTSPVGTSAWLVSKLIVWTLYNGYRADQVAWQVEEYRENLAMANIQLLDLKKNGVQHIGRNASPAFVDNLENVFVQLNEGGHFIAQAATDTTGHKELAGIIVNEALKIQNGIQAKAAAAWNNNKQRYDSLLGNKELQSYLTTKGRGPVFAAFQALFRAGGYTASCLAGAYAGNTIYKNFLEQYFAAKANSKQKLLEQLVKLQEQCAVIEDSIAKEKEKVAGAPEAEQALLILEASLEKAQKEVAEVEAQMQQPTDKQSTFKKYSGVACRLGVIAATTYLSYITFKAFDERFLAPGPTTLTDASLETEWQRLEAIKNGHEAAQTDEACIKSWLDDVQSNERLGQFVVSYWQTVKHRDSVREALNAAAFQQDLSIVEKILSLLPSLT